MTCQFNHQPPPMIPSSHPANPHLTFLQLTPRQSSPHPPPPLLSSPTQPNSTSPRLLRVESLELALPFSTYTTSAEMKIGQQILPRRKKRKKGGNSTFQDAKMENSKCKFQNKCPERKRGAPERRCCGMGVGCQGSRGGGWHWLL